MAVERGEELGVGAVGYAIKGERKCHPDTGILFVTTGVLLRRLVNGLGATTHVIVDEVHERSVDTDFLLAILKRVLRTRPDVKLVLMSATMDEGVFAKYFEGLRGTTSASASAPASSPVPCISVPGFTHPVKDVYLEEIL